MSKKISALHAKLSEELVGFIKNKAKKFLLLSVLRKTIKKDELLRILKTHFESDDENTLVYIPGDDCQKKLSNFFQSYFSSILGYSEEQYNTVFRKGKILLIVDDYHVVDDLSWLRDQLREWNGPSWDRLKVLVFCSELHCRLKEGNHYQSSFYTIEGGVVRRSWFLEIKDQLLSHEEQTSIIEHYCAEESTEWDLDTYVWYSNQIPGLKDLLAHRLFLSLFLEELPGHFKPSSKGARKITRADVRNIYQHLIDGWIVRHSQSEDIDEEQSIALASDIRELSVVLAKVMSEFKPKKTHIKRSELLRLIEKSVNKKRVERAIRLCPICINEQDEFEFINPVIQGLFEKSPVADYGNLFEKGVSLLEESDDDSSELALLSRTVLSDGVVGGLSQKILDGDKQAAERYLGYVKASAKDERLAMASVNSGTIMVRGGVNLSGENFSTVKFSAFDSVQREQVGADLRGGYFEKVKFINCDLTRVNFTSAWLRCAIFQRCNMLGIKFGRFPSIVLPHNIRIIKKILITGDILLLTEDNKIYWFSLKLNHYKEIIRLAVKGITDFCSDQDGKFVAIGSENGAVEIWSISWSEKSLLKAKFSLPEEVKCVVVANYTKSVLIGTSAGLYVVYNISDPNVIESLIRYNCERMSIDDEGRVLAISDDKYLRTFYLGEMFDCSKGRSLDDAFCHRNELYIKSVYVSSNGMFAAFASQSRIMLLNLKSRKLKVFDTTPDPVNAIYVTNDGELVVTGRSDHSIELWDIKTGKIVSSIYSHKKPVMSMFVEESEQLIFSNSLSNEVVVHRVSEVVNAAVAKRDHNRNYCSMAISSDGKFLFVGLYNGVLEVFDMVQKKLIRSFVTSSSLISCIRIDDENKKLYTSHYDGFIRCWDLLKFSKMSEFKVAESQIYNFLFFNADNFIVSYFKNKVAHYRFLDKKNDFMSFYEGADFVAFALTYSRKSNILACVTLHGYVIAWDLQSKSMLMKYKIGESGHSIDISRDGRYLVAASSNGKVFVWDLVNKTLIKTIENHKEEVRGLCFINNEKIIVSACVGGKIVIQDLKGRLIREARATYPILGLRVHESSKLLTVICDTMVFQAYSYNEFDYRLSLEYTNDVPCSELNLYECVLEDNDVNLTSPRSIVKYVNQ